MRRSGRFDRSVVTHSPIRPLSFFFAFFAAFFSFGVMTGTFLVSLLLFLSLLMAFASALNQLGARILKRHSPYVSYSMPAIG